MKFIPCATGLDAAPLLAGKPGVQPAKVGLIRRSIGRNYGKLSALIIASRPYSPEVTGMVAVTLIGRRTKDPSISG